MPRCKPKNKIACASSAEHRGRVLRGSDRSAEYRLAQTATGRRQYEREYGRPSQAPGERSTMLDLKTCGSSTRSRVFRSKSFVSVAQKAHIRSMSQVILSDVGTTNRGVLCLAPIGRLAYVTTRSSRSFCSALRSIRQSNNVNERCTKDDPDANRPGRVIWLAGRSATTVRSF